MKNATKKVAVAHFKRWTNRSSAVFNSLGREVKVGVLLVAYMITCPSANVFSQIPQEKKSIVKEAILLEDVVVSAQRSTVTYADIARVVSVITKAEIKQAGVQSINELLEFAIGVDVRQRGQHGVQADITIRGGSFDQVLVLLNGVNVSDPQTGHLNLNLPISLEAIEQVEIVSGAASRIYGANAFTGAVNLITGGKLESQAEVKIEVGEHGLLKSNLTTTVLQQKFRHLVSMNYSKSDGYIPNSDYKTMNAFYQGQWQATKRAKYDVQLGAVSKNYGANTFYSSLFPSQYENVEAKIVSAKAEFCGKVNVKPTIYYRRQTDRFELFRDMKGKAPWYKHHNYHVTDVYGANLNLSLSSQFGKTAFGGDFRSENVLSNVLGKPRARKRVHGEGNAFYDKEDGRNNISLFVEHSFGLWSDRFTATAGVMMNYNNAFNDEISWFPGLDISFRLNRNFKLYATANKALRLPTFTDLYYKTSTHQGNVNLQPEEAISYEGGLKVLAQGIDGHISYFARKGRNLIDWTKKQGTDKKWFSQNLTNVDFYGGEVSVGLKPFFWGGVWKFIKLLRLTYSYTKIDNIESTFISDYVLDNLKHKFDGAISLGFFQKIQLSVHTSWQDRAGSFEYYATPSSKPVVRDYASFWLLNSRLSWFTEDYEIFAQVENLLDEKYYDIGNVIQPGRWISGGINIKLRW